MNFKNNNIKVVITELFKFECSVLNVIVKLIAQQSSRLRRDGSRASTSHWARPHTHFENMLELKIKNYIKKIVDLLPNAIIKMGVGTRKF